jgi:hypothetical protein
VEKLYKFQFIEPYADSKLPYRKCYVMYCRRTSLTETIYEAVSETTEISERRISVSGVLKILGVSLSGYKAWKKRKPSKTELRRNKIKEEIVNIYNASYQNYGAPKITAELRKNGETISERTIGKYMNEIGIKHSGLNHTLVQPLILISVVVLKIFSMSSLILSILTLYGAVILHIFGPMKGLYI